MIWRSGIRGLWCWLASAGLLAGTVLPQGNNHPLAAPGLLVDLQNERFQAWQFYYTPWGRASLVRLHAIAGGTQDEAGSWCWEDASLYHFTRPGVGLLGSQSAPRRLRAHLPEANLNLLPVEPRLRVYASLTEAAYSLYAWQAASGADLELAGSSPVPEPSPLAMLGTGLVCIFLATRLRRGVG